MTTARKNSRPISRNIKIEDLQFRPGEAEDTLRAIRRGEVDGLLVQGPEGSKRVYTLKGADESYRTLVESMNEGAMILDARETILYANRRLAEILQAPLSRVIGARAGDFVPAEHRALFSATLIEGLSGPRKQELPLRRADQTTVTVQISANSAEFDGLTGLCVLVSDLTEQKEREAARGAEQRRHATELETANQELESFIYSVSHDLRAPLRHIHRFSTIVREENEERLDEEALDFLGRVALAAEQMDRLIEGLLGYSRLSRGGVSMGAVDTTAVVEDIVRRHSEEIRESRADVRIDRPLEPVWGDVLLLTQAVSNLVSNALKFVAPGAVPKIRIRTERRGRMVRLWVEDQGIGISRPDLERKLFHVFERLDGQKYPGTGIGLAIVKKAADRMGGSVGVESEAGRGSRFWIELFHPKEATR